jgi:hypothetical protein
VFTKNIYASQLIVCIQPCAAEALFRRSLVAARGGGVTKVLHRRIWLR